MKILIYTTLISTFFYFIVENFFYCLILSLSYQVLLWMFTSLFFKKINNFYAF